LIEKNKLAFFQSRIINKNRFETFEFFFIERITITLFLLGQAANREDDCS